MHDKIGVGVVGGLLLVSIVALLSKNPTVLSDVFGGGSQLLSVAMGGQYTGMGAGH
jgi:hypothetical protein